MGVDSKADSAEDSSGYAKPCSVYPDPFTCDSCDCIPTEDGETTPRFSCITTLSGTTSTAEPCFTLRSAGHALANQLVPLRFAIDRIRYLIMQELGDGSEDIFLMLDCADHAASNLSALAIKMRKAEKSNVIISDPHENPDFKPVDLNDLVRTIVSYWQYMIGDRVKINLHTDDDNCTVLGDESLLSDILYNVIRNAEQLMKGQEEPQTLDVRVIYMDQLVQVLVQDSGPGIKPEDEAKIFNKYFSTKGGQGIGLNFSRASANKMGGDITIINNSKREDLQYLAGNNGKIVRGATVILELPVIEK